MTQYAQYNGHLYSNQVFASIFNMIISQQVLSDNVKGTYGELADKIRTEGSMYGDTLLFYATDALKSYPWNQKQGSTQSTEYAQYNSDNLLKITRPDDPKCQSITLDKYRQCALSLDRLCFEKSLVNRKCVLKFQ